jgi:uncharacterized membrane protein YiaA
MDCERVFVYTCITANVIFSILDRVSQIVYYNLTSFLDETVKSTCLAFILIKTCSYFVMMVLYLLSIKDSEIPLRDKIPYFFAFMVSTEVNFSVGVHKTFKSRWADADNILVTKKVLNTIHLMFISLPQLLIISIHSSAKQKWETIDIVSIFFSTFFIIWSIVYYILCIIREKDFDAEFNE